LQPSDQCSFVIRACSKYTCGGDGENGARSNLNVFGAATLSVTLTGPDATFGDKETNLQSETAVDASALYYCLGLDIKPDHVSN